jgi:hypothetical protein
MFFCYIVHMETQNQIKRTISKPEAINQIKKLIDENYSAYINSPRFAHIIWTYHPHRKGKKSLYAF